MAVPDIAKYVKFMFRTYPDKLLECLHTVFPDFPVIFFRVLNHHSSPLLSLCGPAASFSISTVCARPVSIGNFASQPRLLVSLHSALHGSPSNSLHVPVHPAVHRPPVVLLTPASRPASSFQCQIRPGVRNIISLTGSSLQQQNSSADTASATYV